MKVVELGLFDRFRSGRGAESGPRPTSGICMSGRRSAPASNLRRGKTSVTPMTVVLVAGDGEWTRRPVAGAAGARRVGEQLGIPVYDVERWGIRSGCAITTPGAESNAAGRCGRSSASVEAP